MNEAQSSELRNALTVVKGRQQLMGLRCCRLGIGYFHGDLAEIDAAVGRIMAVIVELEREAGIGVVVVETAG